MSGATRAARQETHGLLGYPLWGQRRNSAIPYPGETLAEQVINGSATLALGKAEDCNREQDENLWPWHYTPVSVELLCRYLRKPLVKRVPAFLRECSNQGVRKAVLNPEFSELVKTVAELGPVQTRMLSLGFIHTGDPQDKVFGFGNYAIMRPLLWHHNFKPLDAIEGCLFGLVQDGDIQVGREDQPPCATVYLAATRLKHIYPFPPIGDSRVTPEGLPKSGLLDEDGRLKDHARAAQHRVILGKVSESFEVFAASADAKGLAQEVAELGRLLNDLKANPRFAAAHSALLSCRNLLEKLRHIEAPKTKHTKAQAKNATAKLKLPFKFEAVWLDIGRTTYLKREVWRRLSRYIHERKAYRLLEDCEDVEDKRMVTRDKTRKGLQDARLLG